MHVDRSAAIVAGTLCSIVLTACADGGAGGDNDIDALPRLTATEEMRIGSVDDPDAGFSRLGSVDVDRDGNVYVLEVQDNEIRVYDDGGRMLRRIGSRGSGPGEFENAPFFGVHGDTVWAYDTGAGRITLFDRAGTVLSTGPTHGLQVPLPGGRYGYVLPLNLRPDGLFTGWFARVTYGREETGVPDNTVVPVPIVAFDATGAVVDTIGWTPSPPPRMVPPPGYDAGRFRRIQIGAGRFGVPDPPSELPTWLSLHDGYIALDMPYPTAADVGELTVTRYGLNGDTVYHETLRYRPQRYTAAELDSVAARGAASAADGDRAAVTNRLRAELTFPEYKLPVQGPWLANDGGVWLRRAVEPGADEHLILLDPDGELRGELVLPARSRPRWSRGGTLWASVPDEFDVPWLVRYRIEG